jgi:uncharacterized membrane protein
MPHLANDIISLLRRQDVTLVQSEYRYTLTQSVFPIALTVFDVVMIALTYSEYKRIKS